MSDDATDAARYRWIRRRLEVRHEAYADGKARESFSIRIGHTRTDAPGIPGEGYLSQNRFEEDCSKVDAAIDRRIINN